MSAAESADVRANFLAHLAYRTFRHWTATNDREAQLLFEQLTEEARRAWTEVALTIWHEIWVDARPIREPTPIPRRMRSGKVSAFEMLKDPRNSE